jgi:hypothetical protein
MQGWYNIHKTKNVIQLMNRIKDQKNPHQHINRSRKKTFVEIQHPFLIKILKKLGLEGTFLNIIKAMYDRLIANILHNGGKLKPVLLKLKMRQNCPLLPTLIQHGTGIPSLSSKTGERNTRDSNREGRSQIVLFADDMSL